MGAVWKHSACTSSSLDQGGSLQEAAHTSVDVVDDGFKGQLGISQPAAAFALNNGRAVWAKRWRAAQQYNVILLPALSSPSRLACGQSVGTSMRLDQDANRVAWCTELSSVEDDENSPDWGTAE
jgi:hypothetical protein